MAERICSLPECTKPRVAQGYCGMHYRRFRLYGDPLRGTPRWEPKACSVNGCTGRHLARGLCDVHYARWRRHGTTNRHGNQWATAPGHRERFAARVQRTETCWLWVGPTNNAGYGSMRIDGRRRGAHVVAVILDGRHVPDGMQVDHLCGVRNCVRPDHLEVVTQVENLRRARERAAMT